MKRLFLLTVVLLFAPCAERLMADEAKIFVRAEAQGPEFEGTRRHPFKRITDALTKARRIRLDDDDERESESKKLVIDVGPGVYTGSYDEATLNANPDFEILPLLVNMPNVEIRGSTEIILEGGLPSESVVDGTRTLIHANPPLGDTQSLILVVPTLDGIAGNQVTVHGFVLDGNGSLPPPAIGDTVVAERVNDFTFSGNIVRGGSNVGLFVIAATGNITGNYVTANACGVCIGSGSTQFVGNRSVGNRFGGLVVSATPDQFAHDLGRYGLDFTVRPWGDTLVNEAFVEISGNDLSEHNAGPFAFGLRFFMFAPHHPDALRVGKVTAVVHDNTIRNNTFGVMIDVGFPFRVGSDGNPTPPLNGTFIGTFENNSVTGNIKTPAKVSFTRANAVDLRPFKYLEDSTFEITYGNGELDGFWFDHPEFDGAVRLNNVLRVNGVEIPASTGPLP